MADRSAGGGARTALAVEFQCPETAELRTAAAARAGSQGRFASRPRYVTNSRGGTQTARTCALPPEKRFHPFKTLRANGHQADGGQDGTETGHQNRRSEMLLGSQNEPGDDGRRGSCRH